MNIQLEKFGRYVKDIEALRITMRDKVQTLHMIKGKEAGSYETGIDLSNWQTYVCGEQWGGKNEHVWFRTTLKIPPKFKGMQVSLLVSTGQPEGWDISNPQFLLYVNGQLRQGLDVNHKCTLLLEVANGDEEFEIALLGYSGLKEEKQVLHCMLVSLDSRIEDFYYNFKCLFSTLCILDEKDLRHTTLMKDLDMAVSFLDLRQVYSENFYRGLEAANRLIVEKYYTRIQENAPIVSVLGHTHIDIAWLWTIDQTKEKVVRSFSTVLELMDKYPAYQFMSSQPQLYEYVKEQAPELFEKIKEKVAEGRWEVDGGMWVEADCNTPSGESLSRQLLYGIRFFEKEFGISSKTLWLPDVFGYSAALPQLVAKSGMSYMMTTKLDWNQFNRIPHDTFLWEGIDGSRILTHMITTTNEKELDNGLYQRENTDMQTTYNGRLTPNQVLGTWTRYQDKAISEETLQIFGFGDGGGGPTEEMLANYQRLRFGLPGLPVVEMSFQKDFFDRLSASVQNSRYTKKWRGELYFENHRGTYTSMARNKRYNRKCELLFQDAEALSVIGKKFGYAYPKSWLFDSWKRILVYQFHDIIPGTCIEEVYQETDIGYERLLHEGTEYIQATLKKLHHDLGLKADEFLVYNGLSFTRSDVVKVDQAFLKGWQAVCSEDGVMIPVVTLEQEGVCAFMATEVPSKGFKVFKRVQQLPDVKQMGLISTERLLELRTLENERYQLHFNEAWELDSIRDKVNQREVLKSGGLGNTLQIFEDRPSDFDNWNIDYSFKEKMYKLEKVESVRVLEKNSYFTSIEIKRSFQASMLIQKIILHHHHSRIDFVTEIDWHEHQLLLKAGFDVDVSASQAAYEIQYGNVMRSTHENTSWDMAQFEVCAHKWADVSDNGYGVSLMNDCKYGYDIKDGTMRLSLIKCGTYPNEMADQGKHEFTYSLYCHAGAWHQAQTQELAMALNSPLYICAEGENSQVAKQARLDNYSLVSMQTDHVLIDTVKEAEDSDSTILRVYEYKNIRDSIRIHTAEKIKNVFICSLTEQHLEAIEHNDYDFTIPIKGYEVVTVQLDFDI